MRKNIGFRKQGRIGLGTGLATAAALLVLFGPALSPAAADPADTLLGDIGGLRPALARYGITLGLSETSEVLGNVTGGIHRGFAYDGLTYMKLKIDTDKAFGWPGGQLRVSAFQIHGRNLSADNLDVLQTVSNIEADRTTRLWELWYRQNFLDGKVALKIGQQSADQEFIIDEYAGPLFVNAMFGWPILPSVDLYAGAPAYPLSSPAVSLQAQPNKRLTVLTGVFDDNPPGGPFFADSQRRDGEASGTRFNLGTGALVFGEIQYHRHAQLPGIYKLGFWIDTGPFPDWRFTTTGPSPAMADNTGVLRFLPGNFSLYGILDQTVWRPDPQAGRSLGLFLRAMGAPGDRNLVSFSLNAGLVLKAPLPGRADDEFGIGYGLAHVGGRAFAFTQDRALFYGTPAPRGPNEQFIEITYTWQLRPWWRLQPDFQYVFNPLGNLTQESGPTQRVGNEAIFGMRTVITF
jgi:porin